VESDGRDTPLACPWRGAGRCWRCQSGGIRNAQTAKTAVDHSAAQADGSRPAAEPRNGFPALVERSWLNGRLTTTACLLGPLACGAGGECPRPWWTLPERPNSLTEDLLLEDETGALGARRPWRRAAGRSHPAAATGLARAESRSASTEQRPPAMRSGPKGRPPGRDAPDPRTRTDARECCSHAAHGGGAGARPGSIQALTVMAAEPGGAGSSWPPNGWHGLHRHHPVSGCWPPGRNARRRGGYR